jgi:hypothetical protein
MAKDDKGTVVKVHEDMIGNARVRTLRCIDCPNYDPYDKDKEELIKKRMDLIRYDKSMPVEEFEHKIMEMQEKLSDYSNCKVKKMRWTYDPKMQGCLMEFDIVPEENGAKKS